MSIDVFAADEQQAHPIELERWAELARSVLMARGVKGETEVSLLFVDEAAIAALNEQFLGKKGPTDVLVVPHRGRAGPDRALARLRRHRARAPWPSRAP